MKSNAMVSTRCVGYRFSLKISNIFFRLVEGSCNAWSIYETYIASSCTTQQVSVFTFLLTFYYWAGRIVKNSRSSSSYAAHDSLILPIRARKSCYYYTYSTHYREYGSFLPSRLSITYTRTTASNALLLKKEIALKSV